MNYERPATIATTLHRYDFDTRDPAQAKAYKELAATLRATIGRGRWMNAHPNEHAGHPAGPCTLETAHVFDNQWNTARPAEMDEGNGFRVFDWFEFYNIHNRARRSGHYLDITPAMVEIRQRVHVCGYCGASYDNPPDDMLCCRCWDGPHLKPNELHLLRLLPVADSFGAKRPPFADDELAAHMERYRKAQTEGATERGRERIEKRRRQIRADCAKTTAHAMIKRDAALWILERVPRLESNLIHYSHTGRFCFGWREPLSDLDVSELLDHISEFPFDYDIKTDKNGKHEGRTLSS